MKYIAVCLSLTFAQLFCCADTYAQEKSISSDTISEQDIKRIKKAEEMESLRVSHQRFGIRLAYVYAFLDTRVSFELPNTNLSSNLSLEQNFGLPENSFFLTGSFVYRIKPQHGIYSQYYGINRVKTSITDKEYIFIKETIPQGTNIKTHFNTQVLSLGYLLSILKDQNAFLGAYLNLYFMYIDTGVKSDNGSISASTKLLAPLPNLGLIASFKLAEWLNLNAGVGFFALTTRDFGGSIYNFDISLMARPMHWLGVSISYQEFDVRVEFPTEDIHSTVDYNFKGPALGLSFIF